MGRHTRKKKFDFKVMALLLKSIDYGSIIQMIAEIAFIVCGGTLLAYEVSSYHQQQMENSLEDLLAQSAVISQEEEEAFFEQYTQKLEEKSQIDTSTYELRLEEINAQLVSLNLELDDIDNGYEQNEVRSATGGAFQILMSGGDEGVRAKQDSIFQQINNLEEEKLSILNLLRDSELDGTHDLVSGADSEARQIQASAVRKYQVLIEVNEDFYGWLTIPGTAIDLPVVSASDNDYYLTRDFYGEDSRYGTLFLDYESDYQSPSHNLIIYGHNMKDGSMFHDLLKYKDRDFYEEHTQFTLDTIYGKETYEVVAAFYSKVYQSNDDVFKYYKYTNPTKKEMKTFIEEIRKLSRYDTGVECTKQDYYVTLSTCAYHTSNGRFVVIGKKVE